MAIYNIFNNEVQIDFQGVFPSAEIRTKMKSVKMRWDPNMRIWHGPHNKNTISVAQEICGVPSSKKKQCALKLKIKDIVSANKYQLETWEKELKDHVNEVMGEDNLRHTGNSVSKSQESVWMNCFKFIANTLSNLNQGDQEFELIFEYSLPGTVHERPDIFLLTDKKAISLEFKRKSAPQIDDNKDDVAQAIRYKEWLQNHHEITKCKNMEVKSYLVCTNNNAKAGKLRGIDILTKENFNDIISKELDQENICSFTDEWLSSQRTEMPDMLKAIEIMYHEGRIPYISDVNEVCLKRVLKYIEYVKKNNKKLLILINGVPGAGKTAVGQSIVYEENKNGKANAVYLSGNGPLVEVLQYQINKAGKNKHLGENAIQGMKDFKSAYFSSQTEKKDNYPEQSILIFDEAQRAWDEKKLNRGFSEPVGLFDIGDRIYKQRNYAVLIGLYGNGQVIYEGEEKGLQLWEAALKKHDDWFVLVSSTLASKIQGLGKRKLVDDRVFLPVSLRADFIDCSKWVEQAISRNGSSIDKAKEELAVLQNTSMRICVTRDVSKVRSRTDEINVDHPEWSYGILVSNFAEKTVIKKAFPDWDIGFRGRNAVSNGGYGPWFAGESKKLDKCCSVYGNQGLELDCPIILFGGGYIRKGSRWIAQGNKYNTQKNKFSDPETIVENNFRVLLTRARKEMILLIPNDPLLDETYEYFIEMGIDEL